MSKPNVESHHGAYIIGRELVQSDWDFPRAAERCGWNPRRLQKRLGGETVHRFRAPRCGSGCTHSGTDGTVTCPGCGVTASEFISAAAEYLDSLC